MFEHKSQPLLPFGKFVRRVLRHVLIGAAVIGLSLGGGILGYHLTEKLPWLDSLLNASMILGGMGPVNPIQTTAGKLFASFYALYSGVVFLVVVGIMVAPIAHRILHRLHLAEEQSRQ